jgi:hypothetical protein
MLFLAYIAYRVETVNTVAQNLIADTRLQVTVPEEVADRIRVAAAIEGKSQGQIVTDLVLGQLPAVPKPRK